MTNTIVTLAKSPHCDSRILHAPKMCKYCDLYPAEQLARMVSRINFTGQQLAGCEPCPADLARDPQVYNRWPGNRPVGLNE